MKVLVEIEMCFGLLVVSHYIIYKEFDIFIPGLFVTTTPRFRKRPPLSECSRVLRLRLLTAEEIK